MESAGLNTALLAAQLANLALFAAWVALAVYALLRLRRAQLDSAPHAVWAALIVLVPLLGALAFLLASPGRRA